MAEGTADMTAALERALLNELEDLSEDAYAAGWMGDLEFDAWRLVEGLGEPRYGMTDVEPERIGRIRDLRDALGRWPSGYGGTRVWSTTREFAELFADWYRARKAEAAEAKRRLLALPIEPSDLEVLGNISSRRLEMGDFASVRKLHAHGLVEYADWTIFSAEPTEKGRLLLKSGRLPTLA